MVEEWGLQAVLVLADVASVVLCCGGANPKVLPCAPPLEYRPLLATSQRSDSQPNAYGSQDDEPTLTPRF